MGFLRGFSIVMGANALVFVLSLLHNKLLYLVLDKADNGMFFIVMRLSLFVSLLTGDWLRLSTMNIAGPNKSLVPKLSGNSFWYLIWLAVSAALITVVMAQWGGEKIFGYPMWLIPIGIGIGIGIVGRQLWQSLLLLNDRMVAYGFANVLWGTTVLVLNILFLLVFKWGLTAAFIALCVATAVSMLWAFAASATVNGHTFRFSMPLFRECADVGRRAWVALIGMFLMLNFQGFIIPLLGGNIAAGFGLVALFSVSARIFMLFQRGADVAGAVLYSHVVQKEGVAGAQLTRDVVRNGVLLIMPFIIAAAVFGKFLIVLIADEKYLTAYSSLLFMLPGIAAVSAGSVINTYYWGRGYPWRIVIAPYVAAVISVLLTVWLVPEMGVSGATLSFSLVSTAWLGYIAFMFRRDTGYPFRDVFVPRPSDVSVILRKIRRLPVFGAPERNLSGD